MGQLFSKLFYSFFGTREVRILMLGLDNAGKTTILYKMIEPDSHLKHTPTVGFNLETLHIQGLKMQCWDLGGQDSIRPYWRSYFFNQEAIIFVVDSTDKGRMSTAKQELRAVLGEPELQNAILLVLANKQDLPNAIRVSEVSERLGLADLERTWTIMGTSAERGEGLAEAFRWLAERLK